MTAQNGHPAALAEKLRQATAHQERDKMKRSIIYIVTLYITGNVTGYEECVFFSFIDNFFLFFKLYIDIDRGLLCTKIYKVGPEI